MTSLPSLFAPAMSWSWVWALADDLLQRIQNRIASRMISLILRCRRR